MIVLLQRRSMLGPSGIFNSCLNTFPYCACSFVRNSGSLESVNVILKQTASLGPPSRSGPLVVFFLFLHPASAKIGVLVLPVRKQFSASFCSIHNGSQFGQGRRSARRRCLCRIAQASSARRRRRICARQPRGAQAGAKDRPVLASCDMGNVLVVIHGPYKVSFPNTIQSHRVTHSWLSLKI